MTRSKVLLDMMSYAPAPKVLAYEHVISCLTGNIDYTTPDVPLSELTLLLGNFKKSILDSADGSHVARAQMHANEILVDNAYRNEAAYIQRLSGGNEAKILSSGFSVAKPHGPQHRAEFAAVEGPNSGSLKLTCAPVDKAGSYEFQIYEGDNPEGELGWKTIGQSTAASFIITGLVPLKKYYFRFRTVTTQGVTDYCAPISKFVL